MLKKTISYTNYNGHPVTEDFYFNFSKAELIEMEVEEEDGFSETIKKIILETNKKKLIAYFKKLILDAYGKKSDDGNRFIKSDALREEFVQTPAYSDLFMLLATNDKEAAAFIRGIMPSDMSSQIPNDPEELNRMIGMANSETPAPIPDIPTPHEVLIEEIHSVPKNPRDMTREELLAAYQQHWGNEPQ